MAYETISDSDNLTVEVTPEMIAAGMEELREHRFGDQASYILECIYRAMHYARLAASSTKASK